MQAAQARLALAADGVGLEALVDLAVLVPVALALGEDVRPVASALERPRHDFLGMAEAVHGGGVDPIDAAVERRVDGGDRLVVVLRSPGEGPAAAADRPRADADGRQLHVAVAETFLLHLLYNNQLARFREKSARGDRFRVRTD